MCSCSLIQAQDRPEDEPCFASNMLTCLNPNVFPLPLAFPPRRNRVDAALSMLSVSHMRCGETKADNISKETCSSHCQKFPRKKTVERRSTSNVQQCQGKKPKRWPEQPAFVSPSLPNDCAVLGTRASLLKPRRFCFASFVHFVATYMIRKTAAVRYPLPAQFYLPSAGVPPGFR